MEFQSALTTADDAASAAAELHVGIEQPAPGRFDLAVLFGSYSPDELERLAERLRSALGVAHFAACRAGGVLAGGREIEGRPAAALFAARLPGVATSVRHVSVEALPGPDAPPAAWHASLGAPPDARALLLLPDPFTMPVERLVEGVQYAWPRATRIGGLVSGGRETGEHVLIRGESVWRSGALAISLTGPVTVDAVVARGCRPFGKVGTVTLCESPFVIAVDGRPALRFLQEQLESLSEAERERAGRSPVFLGIATDPFRIEDPEPGDYLVRNLVGVDRASGMIAVEGAITVGRKVRLHMRDGGSSESDLRAVLGRVRRTPDALGALMFSCLGRGRALYGRPNHDSRVLLETCGGLPLAGFFCNGEIGPVGDATFVHGYTAAIALFRGR